LLGILPLGAQEGSAAQEDDIGPVGEAVALETERLAQEPFGAVALGGEVEGALAGDDAEAPSGIGPPTDPEHHEPSGPALAALERLAELRLAEKAGASAETMRPGR
jgi:hypothetical protein